MSIPMTQEQVPDWFTTHRYFDGDSNMEGRNRHCVQRAIFAFIKSGRILPNEFPDLFPKEDPFEWYFMEKIMRFPAYATDLTPISEEERQDGHVRVPLVWHLACLWDAVNSYTNSARPNGPGKRYDRLFSFEVKMLRPEWKCIRSLLTMRAAFNKEEGLSPWEKGLKAKEQEFLSNIKRLDKEDIRKSLQRLCFMDQELFNFLSCSWGGESFRIPKEDRELLGELRNPMFYEMNSDRRSDFDILVDDSYFELLRAVEQKEIDQAGWQECDEILQNALGGTITPLRSYMKRLKKLPILMKILKKYWAGIKVETLMATTKAAKLIY